MQFSGVIKALHSAQRRFRNFDYKLRLARFPSFRDAAGPRFFLFDPGLTGGAGHHVPVATTLHAEAMRQGYDPVVVGDFRYRHGDSTLPVIGYFQQAGYKSKRHPIPTGDAAAAAAIQLDRANQATASDLFSLPQEWFRHEDLVLFPSVTPYHILGIAQWSASFHPSHAPNLAICLLLPPDWRMQGETAEQESNYVRAAFAMFPGELGKRLIISCETAEMAALYAPLVGRTPAVLPLPVPFQTDAAGIDGAIPVNSLSKPVVASMGYASPEKGFALLPDILPRIAEIVPDATFLVHASGMPRRDAESLRERMAVLGDALTLVLGAVSADRMKAQLRSADLLLLPYDPRFYQARGSGLFEQALHMGIPMVLPAGTAMASKVADIGSAVLFETHEPDRIAESAAIALSRLEELRAAAKRHADVIAGDPRGYLGKLVEIL